VHAVRHPAPAHHTGDLVGMDHVDGGGWWSYFSTTLIATLDERNHIIKE